MSGRKSDLIPTRALPLLFVCGLLLGLAAPASAKESNFDNFNFGLAFVGTGGAAARSEIAPGGSPARKPSYSYNGGIELVFPIGDVYLRASYCAGHIPIASGHASDPTGNYGQSASGGMRAFGGKISANTFVSEDGHRRIYFGLGATKVDITMSLYRNYTSGATTGAFAVDATGGGMEYNIHVGAGIVLVQNWTFFLELQYAKLDIEGFSIEGAKNLSGATITGARNLTTPSGGDTSYRTSGFVMSGGLMLVF